jgi:hypothetical protein
MLRTYGRQAMRGFGATVFLGLFGATAALIPVALIVLVKGPEPAHWTLYLGAAIVGGGAIGWLLKR